MEYLSTKKRNGTKTEHMQNVADEKATWKSIIDNRWQIRKHEMQTHQKPLSEIM